MVQCSLRNMQSISFHAYQKLMLKVLRKNGVKEGLLRGIRQRISWAIRKQEFTCGPMFILVSQKTWTASMRKFLAQQSLSLKR